MLRRFPGRTEVFVPNSAESHFWLQVEPLIPEWGWFTWGCGPHLVNGLYPSYIWNIHTFKWDDMDYKWIIHMENIWVKNYLLSGMHIQLVLLWYLLLAFDWL